MHIVARELTKHYRGTTALARCSLEVERGTVFGLLGPNGAGKTTLLRLLLGYIRPTSGSATVDGFDCQRQSVEVRRRLAYLPGDVRLFGGMRGSELLEFFATVRSGGSLQRSLALARRLDLDVTRRVAFMSTGMRQKLALAACLALEVPLVVLDEPTSNLDPSVRGEVAQLVREAQAQGRTVVFSSHVLSEVEEVCDRVAILRAGALVHTQCLAQLRRGHRIRAELQGELPIVPPQWAGQVVLQRGHGNALTIETPGELAPLLAWLASLPLAEMRVEPIGLRGVYEAYHGSAAARPAKATAKQETQ